MESTEKITYTVRKCGLSDYNGASEGYFAMIVRSANAIDHDGLVALMAKKNTTVSRQDIIVVLDLFRETIIDRLAHGYNVSSNLVNAYVAIKGTFANTDESFDKHKHDLVINVSPETTLASEVEKAAQLRKVDHGPGKPVIKSFYDLKSKTTNGSATAGFVAEIKGKNLEMDTDRQDHGLWFVNTETDQKIRVTEIDRNTERRILFTIPETLAPGSYAVTFAGGISAQPRKTEFDFAVTVEDTNATA